MTLCCKIAILKNQLVSLILATCLASSVFAVQIIEAQPVEIIACEGKGILAKATGQTILILQGTPYQIGYQHGVLMGQQVRQLVQKVLAISRTAELRHLIGAFGAPNAVKARQQMEKFAAFSLQAAFNRTKPFIPQRYLEELRGLADGSGVPLEDLQLANIFPELFHCSGFALFGKATADGRLLHGRILDYFTEMGFQDFAVLMVVKPEGFNAFVNVGYCGFIGSVTGMNEKHLAFGEMGGRGEGLWDGMPMAFLMRKAMEQADTLQQAIAIFRDTPRTCEYYYVISDSKIPDARGLACWPDRLEEVKPGQYHPRLTEPIEDTVLLSEGQRYRHLVALVKEKYGRIDVENALKLMDRPVAMNSCLHRVLFEPATLTLWVSNAAPASQPNYQAHHQPYYRFDFKHLLNLKPN